MLHIHKNVIAVVVNNWYLKFILYFSNILEFAFSPLLLVILKVYLK